MKALGYKKSENVQNKKKYVGFCVDQFRPDSEYLVKLKQDDFEDGS